jgi:glycosyltransferase involved in cell wall biosynthesis
MDDKPLVSVILIFLNEEKFIQEAIASVLAQTYDDWELLLVNDGSSDRSESIVKSYVQQDPQRIFYLEHEGGRNLGMSASRNLGIQQAKGEYIAFIDGDDLWLPDKLEQQVAIIESQPDAALVCGRTQWWYSWTRKPEDQQCDFLQKLDVPLNTLVQPPTLLLLFLRDEWASLCDILVRRTAIETVGGYEDNFPGMYEDQVFHTKLCLTFPAFVSSECWYRYRQHDQACTIQTHTQQKYYNARKAFLIWLEQYLKQQQAQDTEVWQFVQQNLWHYRYPLQSRLIARLHRLQKDSKDIVKQTTKQVLPISWRKWINQWQGKNSLPVGCANFGSFRRLTPISDNFGFDRGLPIDRYYIENFLLRHSEDIKGRVLELLDNTYTLRFGGDRVTQSDILHAPMGDIAPSVSIVADLTCADNIPSDSFDCIILTQTLQFIYDYRAAIRTVYRILKPGGVLLLTVPGISQISRNDMDLWGEYWRFTQLSIQRLFEEIFPPETIKVENYGNILTATAFMYGLATQELRQSELDYHDPNYEVIITLRAVKPRGVEEVVGSG